MRIYFSGLGGVAIGPLAEIAFDAGYDILGSDSHDSLMTAELKKRGVDVAITTAADNLAQKHAAHPIDWLVHSAALPADHPELAYARQHGIKVTKREALLVHIIKEKDLKLIAVSGTHGKTTTTSMLVWAFLQLGIPISFSVGSTLSFTASGVYTPGSEYFIYECDEFDRNFLHFSPYLSLVTSVDYDHADTYPTREEYDDAFRQFGMQSQQLIAWDSQRGDLFEKHPDAWLLTDAEVADVHLPGAHNRRNATLVLKALEKLGLAAPTDVIESFPGARRRFEKLADNLYTDYGHHPIEIAATLQLARELSDHVVLVYQPHQNIRQHEIKDDYADCLDSADRIYWLPTYLSREDPALEILTPKQLTATVPRPERITYADMDDSLWSAMTTARQNGALVLCMGAGDIDAWVRSRLA